MKIGLFGFDFESSNKGCLALTYTFLDMLRNLTTNEIEIINFSYNQGLGKIPEIYKGFKFENYHIHLKSISSYINMKKKMEECDLFFDETFGDGFSDIYGKKWNVVTDTIKQTVLKTKTPLILMPQTYGPFSSKGLEKWAMKIIKGATLKYTRDDMSSKYVEEKSGVKVEVVSDMAFKLPYDKSNYKINNDKTNVGLNISSLLWDSEWAKENHFGLKFDYKEYHYTIIDWLIENNYNVHIIPHVINLKEPNHRENDYRVCLELKEKYGDKIYIAPPFETPVEAKSYIANMDVFIGSRMHATIAAISSGVATIPFSYSRKFEGLYGNINYPYVVSAREEDLITTIKNTKEWITNNNELKKAGKISVDKAIEKLNRLETDITKLLNK